MPHPRQQEFPTDGRTNRLGCLLAPSKTARIPNGWEDERSRRATSPIQSNKKYKRMGERAVREACLPHPRQQEVETDGRTSGPRGLLAPSKIARSTNGWENERSERPACPIQDSKKYQRMGGRAVREACLPHSRQETVMTEGIQSLTHPIYQAL